MSFDISRNLTSALFQNCPSARLPLTSLNSQGLGTLWHAAKPCLNLRSQQFARSLGLLAIDKCVANPESIDLAVAPLDDHGAQFTLCRMATEAISLYGMRSPIPAQRRYPNL